MTNSQLWFKPNELPQLMKNVVHVWQIPLTNFELYLSKFFTLLSEDEKIRAKRFHFERDQSRFTLSRGILRLLLGNYLTKNGAELTFSYHQQGKPYLADHPNLQFNISHSEKLALIAITYDHPVGIDVEFMEKKTDIDGVVKRFFSAHEIKQFNTLPDELKKTAFFKGWTCKEAFLKAIGAGLTFSLKDIEVDLNPDLPAAIIAINDTAYKSEEWSILQLSPAKSFTAALVINGPSPTIQTFEYSNSLLKFQQH